ncbi:MAG: PQQ-dependent sugar dehydrogenase [Myxococcota bacterium]|nr:PQQ-dependent sugar dehydrogenase [Myxococcota bacterium]
MSVWFRVFATSISTLLLALAASADLRTELVIGGIGESTYVTSTGLPGDDRLVVLGRSGRIRLLRDGALLTPDFLDLSQCVAPPACTDTEVEGGLLGIAFSPDYANDGHFYVYRTLGDPSVGNDLVSRLSRFTVLGDPTTSNVADASSEQVLFEIDQPAGNHNGGTVAFRGDHLYLGLGDGGPGRNGQDDSTLLGKMLRFDLTEEDPQPEVYAKGLRNPYRFAFDPKWNDLYIADVGSNLWEEVNVLAADAPAGTNFGWDVEEGSACKSPSPGEPSCGDPSLVRPTFAYDRSGGRAAIVGGVVYRGALRSLRGHYVFADYLSGEYWSFLWNPEDGIVGEVVDRRADFAPSAGTIRQPVAFGTDSQGELYVLDRIGSKIFKLVGDPEDLDPDSDGDGIFDPDDNCHGLENPDQIDTNEDGYGNACDPDYNGDGAVGVPDFNVLRGQFGLTDQDPGFDPAVDHNGDGAVGVPDFNVFRSFFGLAPGPSGLSCAGTIPCVAP